jgi:predicted acyl esterase
MATMTVMTTTRPRTTTDADDAQGDGWGAAPDTMSKQFRTLSKGAGLDITTCTYFETAAFKEEFRIAGLPHAELTVVPRGPGGHLTLYLYAASDKGMNRLGWGQVDLRFRKSSTQPQGVSPGQRLKIAFDMQPLDAVVEKGSRLYLVVSSGSGWNRLPGAPASPIELAEGKGQSSFEVVNVEPRSDDFFKPPEN